MDSDAKITCWTDSDCRGLEIPPCNKAVCDTESYCRFVPDPSQNDQACDDKNVCTLGDKCENGLCKGAEYKSCDDGNPCTKDDCDNLSGCIHQPDKEGLACDDQNPCTEGETCQSSQCRGGKMICMCITDLDCVVFEDGNLCNGLLQCDPDRHVCIPDPATVVHCIQPQNLCLESTCQPSTGKCVTKSVADGSPCNDFDPCTINDTCVKGQCTGVASCNDANPCTRDLCNHVNGACKHDTLEMDGTACGDEMVCISGECQAVRADNSWPDSVDIDEIKDAVQIDDSSSEVKEIEDINEIGDKVTPDYGELE